MTKMMKTRKQLVAVPSPSRSVTSAVQHTALDAQFEERVTRRRSSAWDPYEVWRTRVKGEDSAEDAKVTPAA